MRILVVGAGVVGLTCAVRLAEAGHRVDVVARDLPLETTSSVAAALWYPYLALPRDKVVAWSKTSYEEFAAIAAADPDSGVRMLDGTEVLPADTPDPWWRAAVPELRRTSPGGGHRDGWSFVAPAVDMPVYLRWLQDRLAHAGGTVTRLALGSLPNHTRTVVNAAGLAAGALAGDQTMQPVRGQVVVLEQVGLDRWWLDSGTLTYVVPRANEIVVGGTEQHGSWDRTPDEQTAEQILRRARDLVPELEGARVLRHRVGLRPGRPAVRVEEQRFGERRVLHCYGHGGAGVTLSWGTADEILQLL
ncbi:MAG: FAD-dependent oxidoreductase [Nocardioidaceae bacterium]